MLRPFALHRPGTAEDACALLATLGEDAAPYAGGTELLLLMKLGLLRPPHLVDVKRIAGFGDIADGTRLTIGARSRIARSSGRHSCARAARSSPRSRGTWPTCVCETSG